MYSNIKISWGWLQGLKNSKCFEGYKKIEKENMLSHALNTKLMVLWRIKFRSRSKGIVKALEVRQQT